MTGPPGAVPWATVASLIGSYPNHAFAAGPNLISDNTLTSPSFTLPAGPSKLIFTQNFDLEEGYDGGVLEIAIAGGAFTDIIAAGGSFVVGAYNGTIAGAGFGNPLAGRAAWTGSSSGTAGSIVNMPPAAAGRSVQLRWRLGTDRSVSRPGWKIDEIVVLGPSCAAVPTTVPWGLQGVASGNLVTFSWRQPAVRRIDWLYPGSER